MDSRNESSENIAQALPKDISVDAARAIDPDTVISLNLEEVNIEVLRALRVTSLMLDDDIISDSNKLAAIRSYTVLFRNISKLMANPKMLPATVKQIESHTHPILAQFPSTVILFNMLENSEPVDIHNIPPSTTSIGIAENGTLVNLSPTIHSVHFDGKLSDQEARKVTYANRVGIYKNPQTLDTLHHLGCQVTKLDLHDDIDTVFLEHLPDNIDTLYIHPNVKFSRIADTILDSKNKIKYFVFVEHTEEVLRAKLSNTRFHSLIDHMPDLGGKGNILKRKANTWKLFIEDFINKKAAKVTAATTSDHLVTTSKPSPLAATTTSDNTRHPTANKSKARLFSGKQNVYWNSATSSTESTYSADDSLIATSSSSATTKQTGSKRQMEQDGTTMALRSKVAKRT